MRSYPSIEGRSGPLNLLLLLAAATGSWCAASRAGEAGPGVEVVSNRVSLVAAPFNLSDVRLLDGPFKVSQETDRAWLLRVDPDRMLHNFRVTAGLPSGAKPYGGWEDPNCELRGHAAGHYLSALSLMHAATGDAEMKRRADYLVAELAKCQAAMPGRLSVLPAAMSFSVSAYFFSSSARFSITRLFFFTK